jgi:hypothetical protein
MADERKRATIERKHGETIHVTDITTGRTAAITLRGAAIKLECVFPRGMLVRRAELLDETASVGVES